MNKSDQNYYYLIRIRFLGFRYHGWQKQPGLKTVQAMVERTIAFVLGKTSKFKILGASRTDAMVSAMDFPVELFTCEPVPVNFLNQLNNNLPADIRANSIEEIDKKFNVIKDVLSKEYHYRFNFNVENDPFNAPLINYIPEALDINLMKTAVSKFMGTHDLSSFAYPFEPDSTKIREIKDFRLEIDDAFSCYKFCVIASGFMRHQVRLMVGAVFEIGKGNLTQEWLEEVLDTNTSVEFTIKAPASGLILHKVHY